MLNQNTKTVGFIVDKHRQITMRKQCRDSTCINYQLHMGNCSPGAAEDVEVMRQETIRTAGADRITTLNISPDTMEMIVHAYFTLQCEEGYEVHDISVVSAPVMIVCPDGKIENR